MNEMREGPVQVEGRGGQATRKGRRDVRLCCFPSTCSWYALHFLSLLVVPEPLHRLVTMPPRGRRTRPSAIAASNSAAAAAAASASAASSASPASSSTTQTLYYPSYASVPSNLTPSEAQLKVARHSRCSAFDGDCVCTGLRPSPDVDVEARSVKGGKSDEAREKECASQWKKCGVCGHGIAMHGRLEESEGGEEERLRRVKVAIRLDELLEVSYKR